VKSTAGLYLQKQKKTKIEGDDARVLTPVIPFLSTAPPIFQETLLSVVLVIRRRVVQSLFVCQGIILQGFFKKNGGEGGHEELSTVNGGNRKLARSDSSLRQYNQYTISSDDNDCSLGHVHCGVMDVWDGDRL